MAAFFRAFTASGIDVDLIVDVCNVKQGSPHLGSHHANLAEIMKPEWYAERRAMFTRVKTALRDACAAGRSALNIAVVCTHGRQASVALSIVLRHVLKAMMLGLVVDTHHLCAWHWQFALCQFRARLESLPKRVSCSDSGDRKALLEQAFLEYEEI